MPKHKFWQHTWVPWKVNGVIFSMVESCACGKDRDHDHLCEIIMLPKGLEYPVFDDDGVVMHYSEVRYV